MSSLAFQDQYLDARADCWGCGRNNADGLHVKSYWDGDEAIANFTADPEHTGHKGVLNGGIIATLMDCHCMGLAMARAYRTEDRQINSQPPAPGFLPRWQADQLCIFKFYINSAS